MTIPIYYLLQTIWFRGYIIIMSVKRRRLSLKEKIDIIEASVKTPLGSRKLAEKFGVGRTQVCEILKNKVNLIKRFEDGENLEMKRRFPNTTGYAVDQAVYSWLCGARNGNVTISGPLLKQKALEVARDLNVENFSASNGWLGCFCRRHNVSLQSRRQKQDEESPKNEAAEAQISAAPEDYRNDPLFFIDSQGTYTANGVTDEIKVEPTTKMEPDSQSGEETVVIYDDEPSVISNANSLDNSIIPVSQAADEFFQEIEFDMNLKIPPYLKNALIYTGYDNAASLKNLSDEDFEEMQNFVRNQFGDLFSNQHTLLEQHFGIFSHNIKQFQILPGHKKLLLAISEFLSNRNCDLANAPIDIIKIE